ncbi:MAG: DVUA0089 family protein [Planctomycetota bacterium]
MARHTATAGLGATVVALAAGMASGQSQMNTSGVQNLAYIGHQTQDFTIPDNPGATIRLKVQGGDGGDADYGQGTTQGGQGATVTLNVTVGDRPGELRPGGRLRFIIGQEGYKKRKDGDGGGGGGGGGSGVLYEADGVGDDWVPLAVAGAGGGAYRGFTRSYPAFPASLFPAGNRGNTGNFGKPGDGGAPGQGGFPGTRVNRGLESSVSGGGGGFYSDGVSPDSAGSNGRRGFPAGGRGGRDGSHGEGGWGCGGGGAGGTGGSTYSAAGGGGGWGGGGGGANGWDGGGGGSYFDTSYGTGNAEILQGSDNGIGSYEFTFVPTPPGSAINVGAVGLNGQIQIDTRGSVLDTVIGLYDERGKLIGFNDDEPGSLSSLIDMSLEPGDYWVVVAHFVNSPQENFRVGTNQVAGGPFSININGVSRSGDVPTGGSVWYRFRIGERPTSFGDLGTVGLLGNTVATTAGSLFDTVTGLYDDSGNLLAWDDDGAGNRDSRITRDLDGGRYWLMVTGYRNVPDGFFTVRDSALVGDSGSYVGSVGSQSFSGSLAPDEYKFYRFDVAGPTASQITDLGVAATAGSIDVNTTGSSFDTVLTLLRANGELIQLNDDSNGTAQSQILTTLEPGTYYAAVAGWPAYVSWNFSVLTYGGPGTGGTIAGSIGNGQNGVDLSGTLAPEDARFFRFQVGPPPQACSAADLAAPLGVMSQTDVTAFVNAFFAQDPRVASMAAPYDVISNADVNEFVRLFQAGCPN